jgi:copper chaperone
MKTYKFKTNINCGSCIRPLAPVLNADTKIKSWNVDTTVSDKLMTVEVDDDITPEYVAKLVKLRGFSAEVVES